MLLESLQELVLPMHANDNDVQMPTMEDLMFFLCGAMTDEQA